MQAIELPITTDASGDGSATYNTPIKGLLHSVQLVDGTFDDGVDLTLYDSTPNGDIALLTVLNWNTDKKLYPRTLEHLDTDGTALATHTEHFIFGKLKAVIAQGGNAKAGTIVCAVIS